ncbi:glycosyltransferase family 8 protein [Profundibacter sp.]
MSQAGNEIEFSRDAKFANSIVLASSREFAPYALFLIDQIANAHPERDFDFCLLTQADIPPHPLIDKHGIRICKIIKLVGAEKLPELEHISIATFFRVLAPAVLGDDYRRLLYMDCDMFYRRGDLSKLLNIDIGDHALAGVLDPIQIRHKNRISKDIRALGLGYFKYINTGLMLFDTARFNARGYGDAIMNMVLEQPEKMALLDQTALNAVLKGNWAELPTIWNWLYNFRSIYYTELYDPAILHFVGRRKAWNHLNGEYPEKYSKAYRTFFKIHFPDMYDAMPACAKPSTIKRGHLRYFIKHIIDMRRFLPHMDQFKHDFDIKL